MLNLISALIPDDIYLKIVYRRNMGERLDLKNPVTFQEKLQWLKLYDRKNIYIKMVDKCDAKKYVSSIIGDEYIIPTLGVWENAEDIDFENLPEKFVLKTTHDSGGIFICKDRECLDRKNIICLLNKRLKRNVFYSTREWPYKGVKPRIIAEKFLSEPSRNDLQDYKFFCFNGEPKFCQVITDRNSEEKIDFYDTHWHRLVGLVGLNSHAKNSDITFPQPLNYSLMLDVAARLSRNIPFLRVDLYNVCGRIYFGELTFYPYSGMGTFLPSEWNVIMGNYIQLPDKKYEDNHNV